jgi:hypothetical protein
VDATHYTVYNNDNNQPQGHNHMNQYQLTGNYGTFEITKIVEAEDEDEAFQQTGIMSDLEDAGWDFTEGPDGEQWEVEVIK